jgi:exodeoxyribonuclease III
MRVASFNCNSIRNRLDVIIEWMGSHNCDILCVQETKVRDEEFPLDPILRAGLHCAFRGQKGYNGVAIVSRSQPEDVRIGRDGSEEEEARVISATFGGLAVVNTYVPQGTSLDSPRFAGKLEFIRSMRDYFSGSFTSQDKVLWAGDFNVARERIDVYDPEGLYGGLCYHPDEHAALDYVREWGFVDVFRKHHPGEPNQYTFWDYRIPNGFKRRMGWRLDHIWASEGLAALSADSFIDSVPRLAEKPSDHTFIVADFGI